MHINQNYFIFAVLKNEKDMEIGEILKTKRLEKGYSQKKVAEMCGITYVTVINVEKGKPCTFTALENICKALDLTIKIE